MATTRESGGRSPALPFPPMTRPAYPPQSGILTEIDTYFLNQEKGWFRMNGDRVAGGALGCHSDAAPTRRVDHSASVAVPAGLGDAYRNLPSRINCRREHSYRDRGRYRETAARRTARTAKLDRRIRSRDRRF